MAKKYRTSLGRADAFFLDIDARRLKDSIEKAGGDVKDALTKAAKRSLPLVKNDFEKFIIQHHHSGITEEALVDPSEVEFIWGKNAKKHFVGSTTKGVKGFTGGSVEVVSEDDCLYFEYGFDVEKGGLPALFLDIGTKVHSMERETKKGTTATWTHPGQRGHFFIYYGVENNLKEIHKAQKEELLKILEGLV